jgi:hypothetical protein
VNPSQAALFMSGWGPCLVKLRRYEQAEPPLREAHRRLSALAPAQASQSAGRLRVVIKALADVCDRTSRPDEADKWRAELASLPPAPSTRSATNPTTMPTN